MFAWMKKNRKSETLGQASAELEIKRPTENGKISSDEAKLLFGAVFKKSATASIFYASCAGMTPGTLNANNNDTYIRNVLTVAPDAFKDKNITAAIEYVVQDCFDGLLSEYWELTLNVISSDEYAQRQFRSNGVADHLLKDPSEIEIGNNSYLRDDLRNIKRKVEILGKGQPVKSYFDEFDLNQLTVDICLALKQADCDRMMRAIDKKWDVLKPIFVRLQTSNTNKYGDYDPEPFYNEITEFLDYHFEGFEFDFYYGIKPLFELLSYIEKKLEDALLPNDIPLDGIDFEHWCAGMLSKQGWKATVSKASGDQGVDVVAKRGGTEVAIQCKRYSAPVGNKAVQEAFAGKQYAQASHACVIATGGFTRSAKELATATGVSLIDAQLISDFSLNYGFENLSSNPIENEDYDEEVDIKELREHLGVIFEFNTPAERFFLQSAAQVMSEILKAQNTEAHSTTLRIFEALDSFEDNNLSLLAPEWQMVIVAAMTAITSTMTEETIAEIVSGRGDYGDETRSAVRSFEGPPPTYLGLSPEQRSEYIGKVFEVIEGTEGDEDEILGDYGEAVLFMVRQ